MSAPDDSVPHLRPLDADTVDRINASVRRLCRDSYTVLMEANAFLASRTPWDGRRLANALAAYSRDDANPEIAGVIAELDELVLAAAGLKPRMSCPMPRR